MTLAVVLLAACGDGGGDPASVSVDPDRGSARGGDEVRIEAPDLGGATLVRFGEIAADFTVDGGAIVAVTPRAAAGIVDVEIETPEGTVFLDDAFEFEPLDLGWELADGALPPDDSRSRDAEALDADSDGDLDVLVVVRDAPPRLYVNDGAGAFTLAPPEAVPLEAVDALGLAVGDVDGDGDMDAYLPVYGGQDRLLLGDGAGAFVDATAAWLPADAAFDHDAALHDLDADGDLDVVVAVQAPPEGGVRQDRLYVNVGGRFEDATAAALPAADDATVSVAIADLDGDGDPDLAACNDETDSVAIRLLHNDGRGYFSDAPAGSMPVQATACRRIAIGDLDGDRDLDLIAVGTGQDRAYVNDGMGRFLDRTVLLLPVDGTRGIGVAIRDLDLDGHPDLAIAVFDGQDRLYLGGADGRVRDETVRLPEDASPSIDVVAADFDGDGNDDLLVTTETGEPDRLLRAVLR